MRHPIYAGAFMIWFGLAAAYASAAMLGLTVLYVIGVCVLNINGEEQMMLSRYGREYLEYRRRVGAFVPAHRRHEC